MQYSYVFYNAINIFKHDLEMQREIIPMLLEKIAAYGEDMQVEAGHAFFELIDQKVSKPLLTSDTKLNFFPTDNCLRLWRTNSLK